MKCENLVEKKDNRTRNSGYASILVWRKCGRVAVALSEYDKPLCKACAQLIHYVGRTTPL